METVLTPELLLELGVFTTIRVEEKRALYLEEHLNRLKIQAIEIGFEIPLDHIRKAISTCLQSAPPLARLRVVTWPNNFYNITILPFVQPKDPYILGIASQTLLHPYSHLKTTAYQLYSNLRKKSMLQGYTDMILTTAEGILLETTTANILWYHQNSWYTPARTLPYLKGITLTRLLQQLPNVREGEFRKQDIHETAQLFVCNSLIGLHPATIIRC